MAAGAHYPAMVKRLLMILPLLNFFGGVAKYLDDLFNWPPTPQTDQGELFWVGLTIAFSMGLMVMFGQWWSR